jgi:hypothetical protein
VLYGSTSLQTAIGTPALGWVVLVAQEQRTAV